MECLTPRGAADLVRKIPYRRDGMKELQDAFHHPSCGATLINRIFAMNELDAHQIYIESIPRGQVQQSALDRIRMAHTTGESWDCDDSALFCAWAVQRGFNARVLNVLWSAGRWPWSIKGHNVCIVREGDQYYHIGNWGRFGPFDTTDEIVNDILDRGNRTRADLVGWKVFSRGELTAGF